MEKISLSLIGLSFEGRVQVSQVTVGGTRRQCFWGASLMLLMMLCSCSPLIDSLPVRYVARDGRSTLNLQEDGLIDCSLSHHGGIQFLGGTWIRDGEVVTLKFIHGTVSMRVVRSRSGMVELHVLNESEGIRVLRDWGLDIVFVESRTNT